MKSIYFYLALFIFITNVLFVESMPQIASRKRRKKPRSCTPSTCNGQGVCSINELGNAVCKCYRQFYMGDTCRELTSNCFETEMSCHPINTDDCWDYYGGRQCFCRRYFYGKRCQSYGYSINFATYPGAYFLHEPSVNSPIPIYVVFLSLEHTKKFTVRTSGLNFEIAPQQFTHVESSKLKLELYSKEIIPTITKKIDAIIPQEYFFIQSHYFFHTGPGRIALNSYIRVLKKESLNSYMGWMEDKVGTGINYAFGAWDYTASITHQAVGSFENAVHSTVTGVKGYGQSILGFGKDWLPSGVYDYIYQDVQSGVGAAAAGVGWVQDVAGQTADTAVSWAGSAAQGTKDYGKWTYAYGRETIGSLSGDSIIGQVFQGIGSTADHMVDLGQDMWTGGFEYANDLMEKEERGRQWEEIVAPDQGPDEHTEISYDLTHKIYTIHLSDNWYYEYNAIVNGSLCSPDLKFVGGVCSTTATLPTTILKNKNYRMDIITLNRCVGSTISDPSFLYSEVRNETSITLDQIQNVGKSITHEFIFSTFVPKPAYGQVFQVVGQITETDKPSGDEKISSRGMGYGRDMCWFKYHTRIAPVITTNAGAQVYLSTGDRPVIQSYVYFIDSPYTPVTDNMGGNLTYKWTCTVVNYGWIPLHGCDYWFTSREPSVTLSFWAAIMGYIELSVCITKPSDVYVVNEYYCESMKIEVVAYYGVFETWDVPVFFVQCLYNCFGGVIESYGDSDRGELILLKTECVARCNLVEKFMWSLNNVEVAEMDASFFFWENAEVLNAKQMATTKQYNYKMLKPNILGPNDVFLNVHVMGKKEHDEAWGRYIIKFFINPPSTPIFASNCIRDQTLRGFAYFTDFFLCITNVDPDSTATYMYYIKMTEFDANPGLIIGYSQAPYLADVLLGASINFLQVYVFVTNDVYGNSYLDEYSQIEVFPTDERSYGALAQLDFIKNIFHGKQLKRRIKSSCTLNAKRGEIMEYTQKMNIILLEVAHMTFSKQIDDEIKVTTEVRELLVTGLKLLEDVKLTMPFDSVQLFTLVREFVSLFAMPLPYDIVDAISYAVEDATSHFRQLVLNDMNYRNKPFKTLRLMKPLIETISALLYPAKDALVSSLSDPMSVYVKTFTEDEIHIQEDEELLISEGYATDEDINEALLRMKLKTYAYGITRSVSSLFNMISTLDSCLTPNSLEKFPWPALEYKPHKDIIYIYVKRDVTKFFSHLNFQVGYEKIAFLNFTKSFMNELGEDTTVSVQIVMTQVMPFWWINASSYYLPAAVFMRIQEAKNMPLETNFTLRFNIPETESNFVAGTAYPMMRSPTDTPKITCHLALIKPEISHSIIVNFQHSLRGKLHVVLRVGKCPLSNEFTGKDKVTVIGPQVNKGKDNYLVTKRVTQKNKPVFLFVGVVTTNAALMVNENIMHFLTEQRNNGRVGYIANIESYDNEQVEKMKDKLLQLRREKSQQ